LILHSVNHSLTRAYLQDKVGVLVFIKTKYDLFIESKNLVRESSLSFTSSEASENYNITMELMRSKRVLDYSLNRYFVDGIVDKSIE
jgi:hypothetical protein